MLTALLVVAGLLAVLLLAATIYILVITRPPKCGTAHLYEPPREPGFIGFFLRHFRLIWFAGNEALFYHFQVLEETIKRGDKGFIIWFGPLGSRIIPIYPEDIHHVLVANASNYHKPEMPYKALEFALGKHGLVTIRDEKLHAEIARKVKPCFSGRCLTHIAEHVIPRHALQLTDELDKAFVQDEAARKNDGATGIDNVFLDWSVRVVCESLFRSVDRGVYIGQQFNTMMESALKAFKYVFMPVWIREIAIAFIPWARNLYAPIRKSMQNIESECVNMMKEARDREPGDVKSFVDVLAHTDDLDDQTIKDTLVTIMSAGFETTATAMSWLVCHLALNQAVQETLYEELTSAVALGVAPNLDDVEKLPYLNACIKESLRVTPSVSGVARQAKNDDVLPSGIKIQAGQTLATMPVMVQRNTQVWGQDAHQFKPERWLKDDFDLNKIGRGTNCAYFPFLRGTRMCLGAQFATNEMLVGCAALIRRFKVEIAPGEPQRLPPRQVAVTTRPVPMPKMKLVRRES